MKYDFAIKDFIIDLLQMETFIQDGTFTKDELKDIIDAVVEQNGGWEKIDKEIDQGVECGYTFDQQIELIKAAFLSAIHELGLNNLDLNE